MKTQNKHVFFFFDEDDSEPKQTTNPLIRRFVSLDLLGLNEIYITNKIKSHIPDTWSKHFYLFEDVETMKISAFDTGLQNLHAFREIKDDGTSLVWYKNRRLVYMDGYLRSLSCSRKYILFVTDFYRRLLLSIDLLVGCQIVHNNIGFKSLVVDFETPILTNFRFGLDLKTNSRSNIKMFFKQYTPDRLQWTLEIHLLCYLQTNKLDSLSFHNIELVVKSVIAENTFLKTFGQKIVAEYIDEGINYFSKYVNKNTDWIVDDILRYANTWDNYALSVAYLKIIIDLYNTCFISKGNSVSKSNSKFLIQFMRLLVTNIHSNPLKRLLVKDTTNKFAKLMDECDMNDLYLLVCKL